ncbi:MAG: hypothetical protein C0621_04985 [Desulfuromonas sp.]|nr:MAG: hypothetical protein C0621_04985 [Desulfuromonas sp.]
MNSMRQQILTLRQSSGLHQAADRGNFALLTTVEELIDRNAAKENLVYMRPQPSSSLEGLREEAVEIKIEKMPLEEIVRLLHAVENHRALLRIKNLRLKTRFDDKTLFDAVFAVATYERAA